MGSASLLLADGRFPSGGHAHSGGVEAAIAAGMVDGPETLKSFLTGKLHTTGFTYAALAAAACHGGGDWGGLDAEADARNPSPAGREASRRQGRQLLRLALALWPGDLLERLKAEVPSPHHPVTQGAAAAAAGLSPLEAASGALYGVATSAAGAAVKLLGLDPVAVHAQLAHLAPTIDELAGMACGYAGRHPAELPCPGAVLCDIYAEQHALAEVRLFAS